MWKSQRVKSLYVTRSTVRELFLGFSLDHEFLFNALTLLESNYISRRKL